MDNKTRGQDRITAIVVAYNEAPRISEVLKVLTTYPYFDEVVVVDDGSTDGTYEVVKQFPVRLVRHLDNIGKGGSMDDAVKVAKGDVLFFCDADVRGLNHKIVDEILWPVVHNDAAMMIAMRNRKIYFLRFIFAFVPLLGGERALRRELWEKVPMIYKENFMVEVALNFYAHYYYDGFVYKVFSGLSQTIKELKYGFLKGFESRVKMFYDIIRVEILLQTQDLPEGARHGRMALGNSFNALFGVLFGLLLTITAYIFSGHLWTYLVMMTGILIFGINAFALLLHLKRLHEGIGKFHPARRIE